MVEMKMEIAQIDRMLGKSVRSEVTNQGRGRVSMTSLPPISQSGLKCEVIDCAYDPKPLTSQSSTAQLRKNATVLCKVERLTLSAADDYKISGIRYSPEGPVRANLIVAGAIGVPQRFYRRFAKFAAAAGFSTLTLDYRGIGLSAPTNLRGAKINCLDWAQLDLAAAVDFMSRENLSLYMMGHSFGGQAFGLLPNHDKVAKFCTFGTGAGWHGWMPRSERLKVLGMWHVLAPLLTRWKGYWPWTLLGMGEDLPIDVYEQWKRWCRYPHYFLDDPSMQREVSEFDRVRTPIMAANSIDDRWAPPVSRDAFMVGYKNAVMQTFDINPAHFGLKNVGHMGYFRSNAQPLWEDALRWLDAGTPLSINLCVMAEKSGTQKISGLTPPSIQR
jgi:predicted alpha/beta hydrolase